MTDQAVPTISLKVREGMEFEKLTGKNILDLEGPGKLNLSETAVLAWIAEKRKNPEATLDAIQDLEMDELAEKLEALAPPPTSAAGSQSK